MKVSKKTIKIIVLITIIALVFPAIAFAKDETYVELPSTKVFYVDETLEIPFDEPLDARTINKANIYVKNSKGTKIPISRNISQDGKNVVIIPMTEYIRGETYTLYISKNVKYRSGKTIGQGIKMSFTVAEQAPKELPTVDTEEKLDNLLKEAGLDKEVNYGVIVNEAQIIRGNMDIAATSGLAEAKTAAPAPDKNLAAETISGKVDYSTTNVQVQGVDEADVVKTDGEYLYQVNNQRIVIAKIYPSNEMKIEKIIHLDKENLYPLELYVDENRLVVIGHSNAGIPIVRSMPAEKRLTIYPPRYSYTTVKLIEYDITDKKNIAKAREIELEGAYVSSRKIGDKLYLVSNKRFNYYYIMNSYEDNKTPSYRDSVLGEEFINIPYEKIAYFPGCITPSYLIVAGIDLGNPKEGVNVSTYLGGGENIYASADNLYVVATKLQERPDDPVIYDSANPEAYDYYRDKETVIYRFAMNKGKLIYTGKGSVPGEILNQFSMGEYDGYFRIATTKGEIWRDDEHTSKNNLYILDKDLNIVGSVEDIAPGEKIYSVRFMGDRAYMVTFKTVDPLFVIDLKDPKNPKILGALKIPGYSDYIHPYDENHIIGFGKDTVEVIHKDIHGNERGRTAYYLGMKIAMFDVSDVANPKELFTEKIGDRGTTSELLYNHKALLFSKEKNLMAFPITVMEVKDEDKAIGPDQVPKYGSFVFQGAYVYNIDLENGFKLKGKISHISEEEYLKSGSYWYNSSKNVERILYINDDLYTISKGMIMANDINNLNLKGQLEIPAN